MDSQISELQKLVMKGDTSQILAYVEACAPSQEILSIVLWRSLDSGLPPSPTLSILLDSGADVYWMDGERRTPLMLASSLQSKDLVELLLAHSSSPKAFDVRRHTALFYALKSKIRDPADIVRLLLSSGADARFKDSNNSTPLHFAAMHNHVHSLKVLLDNYANINNLNNQKDSPLHLAVRNNAFQAVKELLKRNCKVNVFNKAGKLPTDEASARMLALLEGKQKQPKKLTTCKHCRRTTATYCLSCARSLVETNPNKNGYIRPSTLFIDPAISCADPVKRLQSDIPDFVQDFEAWSIKARPLYDRIFNEMKETIIGCLPECEVLAFGSYVSGLLVPTSDIDICIQNNSTPVKTLTAILPYLEALPDVGEIVTIFTAKVPLIKLKKILGELKVQVDISVISPNHRGLSTLKVVKKHLTEYETIRIVYIVIKQIMCFNGFNEAYNGGIGSFPLFLMIVYYYRENGVAFQDSFEFIAEIISGFLYFYAWSYDFSMNIVIDKRNPAMLVYLSTSVRISQNNTQGLSIPDPTCPDKNCAHNTDLTRLIAILRNAYCQTLIPSQCECPFNSIKSILYNTRALFVI